MQDFTAAFAGSWISLERPDDLLRQNFTYLEPGGEATTSLSYLQFYSVLLWCIHHFDLAKLATSQTKFCTSGGVSGNWGVSNWLWSTVHKHSPVPWMTIILWEICQETSDNGTGQVQGKIWRERSKKHLMVSCINAWWSINRPHVTRD